MTRGMPCAVMAIVGCLCLVPALSAQAAGDGTPAPRPGSAPPVPAAAKPASPAPATAAPAPAAPANAQPEGQPVPAAGAPAPGAARRAAATTPAANAPAANAATAETQTYFLAILHHGPKWVADGQPGAQVLKQQHQSHVSQLANLGVLVLGGSCGEQGDSKDPLVGICVLDAPTLEKATKYIQQDPAVIAGHLRAEVIPWLGPKGLCLRLPQAGTEAPVANTPAAAPAPSAAAASARAAWQAGNTAPATPAGASAAAPAAGAPAAGAEGAAPAAGTPAATPAPAPAPAAGDKPPSTPKAPAAPAGGARKPAPTPPPAPAAPK